MRNRRRTQMNVKTIYNKKELFFTNQQKILKFLTSQVKVFKFFIIFSILSFTIKQIYDCLKFGTCSGNSQFIFYKNKIHISDKLNIKVQKICINILIELYTKRYKKYFFSCFLILTRFVQINSKTFENYEIFFFKSPF